MNTEIKVLMKQRDELARCVVWAVNYMNTKSGGGCVMHHVGGKYEMESWLTWFRRELKAVGIEWDDELLSYSRASKADRKKMLSTSRTLTAKLAALNAARTEGQPGGGT